MANLAQDAVYRIRLKGLYLGQETINVFCYAARNVAGGVSLGDALADWAFEFAGVWEPMVSSQASLTEATIESISGGVEFATVGFSFSGDGGSDPMPSTVAFGFRLNRTSKLTRNGYKRFGGITEGSVSGNTIEAGTQAIVDAMAAFLGSSVAVSDVVQGGTADLEPVIVGVLPNGQPDLSRIATFGGASFYGVTTQKSRQGSF